MNQSAVELKNILAKELSVYQELLKLAKDKTKLLVDRKLTELQASVEQEENLVQQLVELEPLRQEQVMAIAGEPVIKLEVLVEKLSDPRWCRWGRGWSSRLSARLPCVLLLVQKILP